MPFVLHSIDTFPIVDGGFLFHLSSSHLDISQNFNENQRDSV
jgi:hypothetical protein